MLTEQDLMEQGYHNRNAITGRFYLGLANQKLLTEAGFQSTDWMTFLQAKQNGYTIKPWSKGIEIQYKEFIPVEEKDSEGNILSTQDIPYIVTHLVFNTEQCIRAKDCTHPALDNAQSSQGNGSTLLSTKQKGLLTRLIQNKIQDKERQSLLLQKMPGFTKAQASVKIKELIKK